MLPGMVVAIQTRLELLHWHPHLHALLNCGVFTPTGNFVEVPQFDIDRLDVSWLEAFFALRFGRGEGRTRSLREHAQLGAQRL